MTDSTMLWSLALAVSAAVVLPYSVAFHRRRGRDRARLVEARGLGIDRPSAQYPYIDPQRCIGCGTCVKACPEGDVLGIVGGMAVVINGLRCVGHARCEEVCPVGAIEVGLGDLKGRADVPLLDEWHESTVPGVYIVGELSGLALIRNAIEQGGRAVERIAASLAAEAPRPRDPELHDLVIVGAGPAGIAAALGARAHGLECLLLEKESGLGGTILHFPRRKLVLTRPVALPLGGGLDREEYSKEEVLAVFEEQLARHAVAVRFGEAMTGIECHDAELRVTTSAGTRRARRVLLALGRRGTPRRLGAPGEELSKVMYQLRDAESYRGQRLLVVGGGDSAVEAAVGLARQPGNQVTISYRKESFFRIKKKNQDAIEKLIARDKVRAAFGSQVLAIEPTTVTLGFAESRETLANDAVFVMIGGDPPFALLKRIGIRFGGEEGAGEPPAPRPPRSRSSETPGESGVPATLSPAMR